MPRLDSLEVLGFKSFADRTRVLFDDGITIVVGPNGCGKSNLTDALSWVLGVRDARSLRGQRMDDFIFSGTSKRRPSGLVEATLTLSREAEDSINFNGLEVDGPVVSITRRLYRTGESSYFINRKRCRLKDIEELLERLGLGFASYALIAQGRVDSLINAKALERRAIVEEAAGISGYKARRRSAELKLDLAQQNLLRIKDILSEVERQLRSLKRQAATARRHKRLKEEFRQIQYRRFALEGGDIVGSLTVVHEVLAQFKEETAKLDASLESLEQTFLDSRHRREDLEGRFSQLNEDNTHVRLRLERAQNSIQFNERQIDSTRRYLEAHSRSQKEFDDAMQKVEKEIERLRDEKIRLEGECHRSQGSVAQQAQKVEGCKVSVEKKEVEVEHLRTRLVKLSADLAQLKNSRDQNIQRMESVQSHRSRLEHEQGEYESKQRKSLDQLKKQEQLTLRRQENVTEVQIQLKAKEREREGLESQLTTLRGELERAREELINKRGRLQSLEELEISQSLYSEGVAKSLRHLRSSHVPVSGTLADFVQISPEFERLVEQFLNQELEYVLVNSFKEAVGGISKLKALTGGRCTFLSLSSNGFGGSGGSNKERKGPFDGEKGVIGTLGDLLTLEPKIQEAFHRVLPERAEAVVVSDLDSAFNLAHEYPERTFLTVQGEVLAPRGLLSVSTAGQVGGGLLSIRREKNDLGKQLATFQTRVESLSQREEELLNLVQQAGTASISYQESLHRIEKEVLLLEHQAQQSNRDLEHEKQALKVLLFEGVQLSEEETSEKDGAQATSRNLVDTENLTHRVDVELGESMDRLSQDRANLSQSQEELHFLSGETRVLEERRRSVEETLSRSEDQQKALQLRLQDVEDQKQEAQKRLQTLIVELEDEKEILGKCQIESSHLQESVEKHQQEYDLCRDNCQRLEIQLEELRKKRFQMQDEISGKEVSQARLEAQLESLSQQCDEDLQKDLEALIDSVNPGDDDAQILDRYSQLKTSLENFGPVNMTALEEYQENEERYTFLSRQQDDLEQSISDATTAIQEINHRSRERFSEAFKAIDSYFREVFCKLFGGGDSGMKLVDDEDLLESGVDVFAQPPGKKLQHVSLLSGGEKTLTAFALMVALFMYRPSRFCMLDEVDASLDEATVDRFNRLIREMSQETQFILVSHNKRTIEMADSLYGVTMEEPGISKVLTVRLSEPPADVSNQTAS